MNYFLKFLKVLKQPRMVFWFAFVKVYNFLFANLWHREKLIYSDNNFFNEIQKRALKRSDISDHLMTLFEETISLKPHLIVELGVRSGESTFVLERAARLSAATLISVDIEDCSHISNYSKWLFVQKDDVAFAKEFKNFCVERGIKPEIDAFFIDTSHLYEHTKQEIGFWFPLLSSRAKVFFHDTNLRKIYKRKDGSIGEGWNNKRGVIRALEDYFGVVFNETREWTTFIKEWSIKHKPYCSGFTILEKLE